MKVIAGKGVSSGIVIGPLAFFARSNTDVSMHLIKDVEAEIGRFEKARALAGDQLARMAVDLAEKVGKETALLFEIHQMMLEDTDYINAVNDRIRDKKYCAEHAVLEASGLFYEMMSGMDDAYMRERAADVEDISRRVIQILTGAQVCLSDSQTPRILFSNDFLPSETVQFEREKVLALVTTGGSAYSHTAIISRTMGIPAVIGVKQELEPVHEGKQTIVDGTTGKVIIEPDEATLREYMELFKSSQTEKRELEQYRGRKTRSRGGRAIKLFANIGNVKDLEAVLKNDAEGIGLFRSEFLYLENQDYPSEEQQFQVYKTVAEKMDGRPVIIRTLDIGADKQIGYFSLPKEENPALGMRAIRVCLTRPEIFRTQLRAIFRASAFGKISIMLPMVANISELRRAREIAQAVQRELRQEGMAFGDHVPFGIMIETPASAVISDLLAPEADFFSIGTNDLTQFTLAVDRQNDALSEFCDTHHQAVLRLIQYTVENAHKSGIWVGICGELGADSSLTKTFLDMGVDELSVNPVSILPLRKFINEIE